MGDVFFIFLAILLVAIYISLMRKILKIIKRKTRERNEMVQADRTKESVSENKKSKKKNKR